MMMTEVEVELMEEHTENAVLCCARRAMMIARRDIPMETYDLRAHAGPSYATPCRGVNVSSDLIILLMVG